VNIEHCDCLSWFAGSGESHEQDGETLMRAIPRRLSASSDPAMAFEPSKGRRANSRSVAEIGSAFAAG
jgi:hypothetical protein